MTSAMAAGAVQPTITPAPTSATTPSPTPAWESGYTSGVGLPYDSSNNQLPAYVKVATTAAECVERCTDNRQVATANGQSGCVAASWRSVAGSQQASTTTAGFAVKKHYKCIASTCTDTWCNDNCNHVPKYCPDSFCRELAAAPTVQVQKDWCVQWQAACSDAAPAQVSSYLSYAGTAISNPTKIVEPSTLAANDTMWATQTDGWSTWMLNRECAWLLNVCICK